MSILLTNALDPCNSGSYHDALDSLDIAANMKHERYAYNDELGIL